MTKTGCLWQNFVFKNFCHFLLTYKNSKSADFIDLIISINYTKNTVSFIT